MKAELVLGFEPCPGDSQTVATLGDALRASARALVEARGALGRLTGGGPGWDGAAGDAVLAVVRAMSARLGVLEDGLADCHQAVEQWQAASDARRQRVEHIVEQLTDATPGPESEERRARLTSQARDLAAEHEAGAAALVRPFDELAEALVRSSADEDDLAGDLDRALLHLEEAVEEWVAENAAELTSTVTALGEVAGLTTVVTELLGLSSFGRTPEDAEGVKEIVRRSPGSHRLVNALRRQWTDVAPDELPPATFAHRGKDDLVELLATVTTPTDDARGSDNGSGE